MGLLYYKAHFNKVFIFYLTSSILSRVLIRGFAASTFSGMLSTSKSSLKTQMAYSNKTNTQKPISNNTFYLYWQKQYKNDNYIKYNKYGI